MLTKAEIEKKKAELDAKIAEQDKIIELYENTHRIEFFSPVGSKEGEVPYQTKVLEYLHDGKKVISLVGGNGIGKTTLGAIIVSSACLGIQPWDGKVLPAPLDKPPIKARVLTSDWEKHANVIVEQLKYWLPVGEYETSKNNVGVESIFKFHNKSTIEILTSKQATTDHEGWQGQIVWADEPFPQDKYVANLRGLRQPHGMGVFLITMTAVSEAWILDEIIKNPDPAYASVTEVHQNSNPYLSEEYLRIFRSSLRKNQIIARVDGGWLNLVGLVWPGFDKEKHIIDPFEIPTDWPVVVQIDHHPSHPNAIGYYAVDPFDRMYVIDETWGHMSAEQEGDDIIRKKTKNAWRINDVFIDPLSKGDMAYIKNLGVEGADTFTKLKERLWHHGIELHVASKDKGSGIRNVEDMLDGPNGTATLFFFRSLLNNPWSDGSDKEQSGHIHEIQRWTYDDENKPKNKDDHFMECLYRSTLTGTRYSKMHTKGYSLKAETEFDPLADNYGIMDKTETEFNVWRTKWV